MSYGKKNEKKNRGRKSIRNVLPDFLTFIGVRSKTISGNKNHFLTPIQIFVFKSIDSRVFSTQKIFYMHLKAFYRMNMFICNGI